MLRDKRIKIITGHYGSGKTEFAVNYALRLSDYGKKVAIADLDVVNPYFRSREYEKIFQEKNIELLGFILKEHGMDLPSVSGNIMKPFMDSSYEYIIDLGGNSAGAKAFSSFRKLFSPLDCDLFFVLNANRPETSDLATTLAHLRNIEGTLNLKVTGIINNTHLIWETTEEDILRGNSLALQLSQETGIPIRYTVCKRDLISSLHGNFQGTMFPIDMLMRKSWM
ncbi:MAG: hypothetical protein ACRC0S_08265 [Fusobacteriaceae bacterium]